MAKLTKTKTQPDDTPGVIHYRPAKDIARALKAWREKQVVDPGAGKTIDAALRSFLRGQGIELAEKPGGDE